MEEEGIRHGFFQSVITRLMYLVTLDRICVRFFNFKCNESDQNRSETIEFLPIRTVNGTK